MKIALAIASEVAVRAGRILLSEPGLESLGIYRGRFGNAHDDRVRGIRRLDGFDLLVSDESGTAPIEAAAAAGISCVSWIDHLDTATRHGGAFADRGTTHLVGANLASGLAPALAAHEEGRAPDTTVIDLAWTEPGTPLRNGIAAVFPDPVGALWARARPDGATPRRLVAPTDGEWAAAMTTVRLGAAAGAATRIVGVADLAPHLEALALAAGAAAAATGAFPAGAATVLAAPEPFLERALTAGLDVAAFTIAPDK